LEAAKSWRRVQLGSVVVQGSPALGGEKNRAGLDPKRSLLLLLLLLDHLQLRLLFHYFRIETRHFCCPPWCPPWCYFLCRPVVVLAMPVQMPAFPGRNPPLQLLVRVVLVFHSPSSLRSLPALLPRAWPPFFHSKSLLSAPSWPSLRSSVKPW